VKRGRIISPSRHSRRSFLETLSRNSLTLGAGRILAPFFAATGPARPARNDRDPFSAPIAPGSPFGVTLVDVGARAGLSSRCVFGGEYVKHWIVETTGCGIAFFAYDVDGCRAIFQLNGSTV